jgi:acyl-coenzyme A synthetase/AMP-(fatty) acid ligase/acyl carrier protein
VLQRIWLETNDYNIQADDKIALLYSCGFGASVTDIFNALLNGATLCLYDFKEGGVTDLTNWLRQEAITLFHLPVALFQQWLDNLNQQEQFLKLRQVTPSGRLYRRDVERCWQHLPMTCRLVQRFASSETGICTRFLIDRQTPLPEPVVPVGYPIADKEILLLNENGQPVTGHGIGEIAVKSRYLSSGYWRNPELTRQKFLPDPEDPQGQIYLTGDLGRQRADGCLEYLGRKDFMVKIRGYRVEPSEVETALFELDIVQQAAVIAHIEADREPCLVAYVVPARQHSPLPSQLYQGLRERVPDYMMPVAFVILDEMPLMPNGKIDRQSLPLPDLSQRLVTNEYIPPGTSTEEKLVEIWEQVLEKQPVGIHDHFFEIGGHSLLATQVIARLQQVFQVPLSFHSLFESPTIADLANQIEAFQWAVQCLSLPLSPDSNDTSVLED